MEFGSIWGASGRVLVLIAALSVIAVVRLPQRRIRVRSGIRRPRPHWHGGGASLLRSGTSLLGFVFAFIPSLSLARDHASVAPDRRTVDAAPPWSRANGVLPPHPLARAEALETELDDPARPELDSATHSAHPAIHGLKGEQKDRLFPRITRDVGYPKASLAKGVSVAQERARSMRLHPAGKEKSSGCRHRVRPGDTLWDISSDFLTSTDAEKVSRLVDRLYDTNRTVIADPDVIYPGQVIRVPKCEN